jgi:hypothetical protein
MHVPEEVNPPSLGDGGRGATAARVRGNRKDEPVDAYLRERCVGGAEFTGDEHAGMSQRERCKK